MSSQNPPKCPFVAQAPPTSRPPWYRTGTPVVTDPVYGEIALYSCFPPLYCYKSTALPDGSYWMWLGGPWYSSPVSPLSGMLFFAINWEYWILLEFVSMNSSIGQSTWSGVPGNGRIYNQNVSITAMPN